MGLFLRALFIVCAFARIWPYMLSSRAKLTGRILACWIGVAVYRQLDLCRGARSDVVVAPVLRGLPASIRRRVQLLPVSSAACGRRGMVKLALLPGRFVTAVHDIESHRRVMRQRRWRSCRVSEKVVGGVADAEISRHGTGTIPRCFDVRRWAKPARRASLRFAQG